MAKLTEIFINDNIPPHNYIVKDGYGDYDPSSLKIEIEGAGTILRAPLEKERYYVGSKEKNFPDALCTAVMDKDGPYFFQGKK
jgi:hypothetical protein